MKFVPYKMQNVKPTLTNNIVTLNDLELRINDRRQAQSQAATISISATAALTSGQKLVRPADNMKKIGRGDKSAV